MNENKQNGIGNSQEERRINVQPRVHKVSPVIGLESIIGAVAMLMMRSQNHKYLFAGDF
ncbi:MAG: hypothetical protein HRT90_05175, partial [Candidatus Margulisbacteria bacterium]|nr:hypothetical protein [Candidatus Margulisiibacteriota bacterium]